jgi:hypothetical protein
MGVTNKNGIVKIRHQGIARASLEHFKVKYFDLGKNNISDIIQTISHFNKLVYEE